MSLSTRGFQLPAGSHDISHLEFWETASTIIEVELDFGHAEETNIGLLCRSFWELRSGEWDIGRKAFEEREECFIPQSSGWEQTSNTASLCLISYTAVGLFRPPISSWSCCFGTVVH